MMDTLNMEKEREYIKKRMEEIRENEKHPKNFTYKIVIAAGEPILMEDAEEFRALARMAEIVEFGAEKRHNEYLDLREQTQIEKMMANDKTLESSTEEVDAPELKATSLEESHGLSEVSLSTLENELTFAPYSFEHVNQKIEQNSIAPQSTFELDAKVDNINNFSEVVSERPLNEIKNNTLDIGLEDVDSLSFNQLQGDVPNNFTSKSDEIVSEIEPKNDFMSTSEAPRHEQVATPSSPFEEIRKHAIDVDFEEIGEPSQDEQDMLSIASFLEEQAPAKDTPVREGKIEKTNEEHSDDMKDEEELFEVVKTTPWQWVKNHKKQIIIGLGITALAISATVVLTQLLPAIEAARQASNVAGLASEMVKNASLWNSSVASEQIALHATNTTLSNLISAANGIKGTFDATTGAWTFGSQTLSQFAASTARIASSATLKVASLAGASKFSLMAGLGSIGLGLVTPKAKSAEYKAIKKSIDNLSASLDMQAEDNRIAKAQEINNNIIASNKLSEEERNLAFKKLQHVLKKIKKNSSKEQSQTQVNNDDEFEFDSSVFDEVDYQKSRRTPAI